MGEPKHNSLKELPKSFHKTKREFEKDKLRFFAKKDRESKIVQGEYYLLLKEMQAYIDKEVISQEQNLIDNFDLLEQEVYLNKYKKKVLFDKEADWVYIDDMTSKDFRKMVKGEENEEDS